MLSDRNLVKNRHPRLASARPKTLLRNWRPRFFMEAYLTFCPLRQGKAGGMIASNIYISVLIVSTCALLLIAFSNHAGGSSTMDRNMLSVADEKDSEIVESQKEEERSKRYHWLFRERTPEESLKDAESAGALDKLDKEIKQARKLYLSGETDNAILKYRSVIDYFESVLGDIPQGNPVLKEMEQRFQIFDDLATKILGPVHTDIPEESAGSVFHLMEKRRICRRILTLKKAGKLEFFDVPSRLLQEESQILSRLWELSGEVPTSKVKEEEEALKTKLAQARKTIHKSSERYTMLRAGVPISLPDLRRDLLATNELLMDFNFLPDRLVIGVITSERAIYHQMPTARSEIDRGVFQLQDKLREFSSGGQSTFMGHAWKEPCRRIFRALMGKLPPLPKDKTTILVIPDRSLWYLPFSALLDSEDRPFGQDRIITMVPSGDMLKLLRFQTTAKPNSDLTGNLILFESIPSIPDDHLREKSSGEITAKKSVQKAPDEERLERLILSNPVYPKPSDIVMKVQKMFAKFDVWVGPTATIDRFVEYTDRKNDITLLAAPLSVWDSAYGSRQPTLFFSPDKRGQRRFEAHRFFSSPVGTRILIMPVAWFDVPDREAPSGDGPLLLSTALFYAGFRMVMVNYSDPNWGADDPYLMAILKKASEKKPPGKVLAEYPRDMPAGLATSFSGKPPSWSGWILIGDPRM